MNNELAVPEECERAISVGRSSADIFTFYYKLGDDIQVPGFLFPGRSVAPDRLCGLVVRVSGYR